METVKKVVESASKAVTSLGETMMGNDGAPTGTLTKMTGCPVAHVKNSLTAGPNGPVMLQDTFLLEHLTQFTREKIPPRNVHALGTGCYGTFTATNDISKYTSAKLFKVGTKTELFTRMSGIFTEQGEADTTRDPRGFALKFYTSEGNWDLMAINTPVFNVRDAKMGPDAVHAFKRDPRTGMWNPTQLWDFVVNHPESLHQVTMLYSNRGGCPMSYRTMHGYGCHTFSLLNENKERHWVKFHLIADLGAKGLTTKEAKLIAGEDPNFLSRDLWDAIERGDYPRWKFCIQVMPEEEGYKHSWTFDPTKVWKHSNYPLIEVGTIELNRNPTDFHSEVEQVAFSSANVVPGIGFSPDKLLQGRLLIYDDAQHHRLGTNFKQLPVNRPHGVEPKTKNVGGEMNFEVKNKFPHYSGSVFGGYQPDPKYTEPPFKVDGPVDYYDYPGEGTDEDYYGQVKDLWEVMIDEDKRELCFNIAVSIEKVPSQLAEKVVQHFGKISPKCAEGIRQICSQRKQGTKSKTEGELVVEKMHQTLGIRPSQSS